MAVCKKRRWFNFCEPVNEFSFSMLTVESAMTNPFSDYDLGITILPRIIHHKLFCFKPNFPLRIIFFFFSSFFVWHNLCVFALYNKCFQFSLRSRTPSLNGSVYSPYTSRKVSCRVNVLSFFGICFFFVLDMIFPISFVLLSMFCTSFSVIKWPKSDANAENSYMPKTFSNKNNLTPFTFIVSHCESWLGSARIRRLRLRRHFSHLRIQLLDR